MPNYSEKVFISELKDALGWSEETITAVKECAVSFQKRNHSSWEEFRTDFTERISELTPEDFTLPNQKNSVLPGYNDFRKAKTIPEIEACLDRLKNHNTQIHLESYLLKSQKCKEDENYFALLWKHTYDTKNKRYRLFLLLYCQTLLTQRLSNKMICWILTTYGKQAFRCDDQSGDDYWMPSGLSVQFANGMDFSKAERMTKLKIAYLLRKKCNCQKNLSAFRKNFTDMFGEESYDPRSFGEMLMLYASYRNIPYCMIPGILSDIANSVLRKLLPEEVSDEKIKGFVSDNLDFHIIDLTKYHTGRGVLCRCDDTLVWNDLKNKVDAALAALGAPVYNQNRLIAAKETLLFFYDDISRFMDITDPEKFALCLAQCPDMYAYYDPHYVSIGKRNIMTGNHYSDCVDEYAWEIYYNDTLANVYVNGTPLDTGWKTVIHQHDSIEERISYLEEKFGAYLDELDRSDSENYNNYRHYLKCDRTDLYTYIAYISYSDEKENLSRLHKLLDVFDGMGSRERGVDFMNCINDCDVITSDKGKDYKADYWKLFDPLDYHDIYLYMCCNTPDHKETFRKLHEDGYIFDAAIS